MPMAATRIKKINKARSSPCMQSSVFFVFRLEIIFECKFLDYVGLAF